MSRYIISTSPSEGNRPSFKNINVLLKIIDEGQTQTPENHVFCNVFCVFQVIASVTQSYKPQ